MIGCHRLYVRIQRVSDSFTHANTMILLGEPSMYRHGLRTRTKRLSMSHMVDMMNMMFAFETISFHVMIGCGIVNLVCVIT
jgi:hypothetical protein